MVEEAEVGVVDQHDELRARLRLAQQRGDDRLGLGRRRHVARRIVREVQQHHELLAARAREGLREAARIEAAPGIEREGREAGAELHLVEKPVVLPELVGQQQRVAGIDEQLAREGEAVRDRLRDDRKTEALAAQGRILGEQLLAPALAQAGAPGRRRVVDGVAGVEIGEVAHQRGQPHRRALLGRDADRGVHALRPGLGLGPLREDAFREVEAAPERREHREDLGRGRLELAVQLARDRVQGLGGRGHGTTSARRLRAGRIYRRRCKTSIRSSKPSARQNACPSRLPLATRTSTRCTRRARTQSSAAATSARASPRRRSGLDHEQIRDLRALDLDQDGRRAIDPRRAEAEQLAGALAHEERRVGVGELPAQQLADLVAGFRAFGEERIEMGVVRVDRAPERGELVEITKRGAADSLRAAGPHGATTASLTSSGISPSVRFSESSCFSIAGTSVSIWAERCAGSIDEAAHALVDRRADQAWRSARSCCVSCGLVEPPRAHRLR